MISVKSEGDGRRHARGAIGEKLQTGQIEGLAGEVRGGNGKDAAGAVGEIKPAVSRSHVPTVGEKVTEGGYDKTSAVRRSAIGAPCQRRRGKCRGVGERRRR